MPNVQVNRSNPPSRETMVGMAVLMTVTSAADMKVEISIAAMTGRRARAEGKAGWGDRAFMGP